MAAAATSAPRLANRWDGAHRAGPGSRPSPSRVAATTATSPEAAAPLKADLAPAAPLPLMRVLPESLQGATGSVLAAARARQGEEGGAAVGPGAMEYLTAVLTSRVYDVADETPLELATKLSERLGIDLRIKREDLQPGVRDVKLCSFVPYGNISLAGERQRRVHPASALQQYLQVYQGPTLVRD